MPWNVWILWQSARPLARDKAADRLGKGFFRHFKKKFVELSKTSGQAARFLNVCFTSWIRRISSFFDLC
jgi:hypothetical protein